MPAAWVTRTDLPAGLPGDQAALDAACELATASLYSMSGRRWAGRADRTIQVFASHTPWWWRRADLGLPFDPTWGMCGAGLPALPVMVGGEFYNHSGCERPPSIRLPDYPIRAVNAVRIGGQTRDPSTYRLIGARFLEDGWEGWPTCGWADGGQAVMEVDYAYGADPPTAGRNAAARLASELAKSAAGQQSALPGYLMQRVRQAVTETYVRTDFLFDKGRTGLADVDLWLIAVNPAGLRRRARSWTPETDPHYITKPAGGTP